MTARGYQIVDLALHGHFDDRRSNLAQKTPEK